MGVDAHFCCTFTAAAAAMWQPGTQPASHSKPRIPLERRVLRCGVNRLDELSAPPAALPTPLQLADVCKRILYSAGLEGWQLGRTRVFLRAGQLAQLEVGAWGCNCLVLYLCMLHRARRVCCQPRGIFSAFFSVRGAAVKRESWARSALVSPSSTRMSACACPSYPQGTRGRQLSEAAVRIQAAYRGMHARTQLRTARAAATRIQVGDWAGGVGL